MSDLLAEVDEMMRQERMVALWKEYGSILITFIIALIVGTGAVSGYKSWDLQTRKIQTTQIVQMIEAADFPENITPEKLDGLRADLSALTQLQAAGTYAQAGDIEKAKAQFKALHEDKNIDKTLRELAFIGYARLSATPNSPRDETLVQTLTTIINNSDSPWRFQARMALAQYLVYKQNDLASAQAYLTEIIDTPGLPDSMYIHAESLMNVMKLKHSK